MTFDAIIPDCLWAVRYDGEDDNVFSIVFNRLSDPEWLRGFSSRMKKT